LFIANVNVAYGPAPVCVVLVTCADAVVSNADTQSTSTTSKVFFMIHPLRVVDEWLQTNGKRSVISSYGEVLRFRWRPLVLSDFPTFTFNLG
jgi:hypothetical protein